MKIASVADVKAKFSAYVQASEKGPVVITRNGKAVAAIVPIETDDDVERIAISYSPRLRTLLARAQERIEAGQGIPHDRFWREVSAGRGRPTEKGKRKPKLGHGRDRSR